MGLLGAQKKSAPKKFLALILKNIKNFQETEPPPPPSPIQKTKTKNSLHGTSQPKLEKISYTLGNKNPEKISYIFLKESFSYISGNGIPEKTVYL